MFFKKRKEEALQELHAVWAESEQKYDAALDKVTALADPAEKVIALKKLESDVSNEIALEIAEIQDKAKLRKSVTSLATEVPVVGAGVAAAMLATGPIGWAGVGLAWAGILGSGAVGKKVAKSLEKKLLEAVQGHVQHLVQTKEEAGRLAEETVWNHVEEIAASPRRDVALLGYGLSDVFAEAAAQHINDLKELEAQKAKEAQAAVEAPKADDTAAPPAAPVKKEKADFSRLSDLGRGVPKKPKGPQA